ncbi:MAG: signal peptidase II [Planctomycetota bacterium]
MPERAGRIRLLTKVRALFWLVAILCAAADLLSKYVIFDSFATRHPAVARRAERRRAEAAEQLRLHAFELGRLRLAELAGQGRLDEFADRADDAGLEPLADAARQAGRMAPDYPPVVLIPGFLHIVYGRNYGGVFGLGQGAGLVWLAFGVVAGGLVVWFAYRDDTRPPTLQVALGLVMAGAVGNVYDRVVFGYVRDFIEVYYWPGKAWPAFNIADAGICVGAAYLALYALLFAPRKKTGKG